ncbi:hypothetical protein JCM16358_12580 [Halanaerocella petrolearia]
MKNRIFFSIILMVLTISIVGCNDPQYMNLRGRVIDNVNSQPLANVEVNAGTKTVTTNAQGYFMIKKLPVVDNLSKQDRMLKVTSPGYKSYQQPIRLQPGDKSVDIKLHRKYMNLTGRVIDQFTGRSLAGIKVEVGNRVVETNANGYFKVKKIHAISNTAMKNRMVKVSAPGYRTYAQPISFSQGTKSLKIKLENRRENKLFFVSNHSGSKDIYLTDIYGNQITQLTNHQADNWAIDWSARRKELLFLSNREGNTNIYAMKSDGSNLKQLTYTTSDKESPIWIGQDNILFTSNRDGDYELYVMDLADSYLRRLTDNSYYDGQAAYSAARGEIAYISETTGERKLHIMKQNGDQKLVLNTNLGTDSSPSWTQGGNQLLFTSFSANQSKLYQINPNGSGLKAKFKSQARLTDYDTIESKEELILYLINGRMKLQADEGEIRSILTKPGINYLEVIWKE